MPEAPSDIDYTVDIGRHETMFRAKTPKGEKSNASVIDIAADLGRTVKAVRARAHRLRIALGRSRFRVKAK